jgi:hypothetical protein
MKIKEETGGRDRTADSLGGRFLPLGKRPNSETPCSSTAEFEDWVVDFSGCEFLNSTDPARVDTGSRATLSAVCERPKGTPGNRSRRRAAMFLLSALIVVSCGALWVSFFDTYMAETKLLFVSRAATSPRQGAWSVEQELELLKSSTLAHRVLDTRTQPTGNSVHVSQVSSLALTRLKPNLQSSVGNAEQLLGSLSFSVDRWDGGGCVTIAMSGDDPRYLKSALNSYIRQYLQSRHELVKLAAIASGPTRPGKRFSGNYDFSSLLDGELARMELMKRNCELALTLMDKKMGKKRNSLGGFLPSGLGAELTSLNRINDELVKLSIKKQHLATRFSPGSREISEVNQEIEGLRRMMRQHLSQQVTFLKTGMEQLQARKREIQAQSRPASGQSESREQIQLCGIGPAAGRWIPVSSDVVIMSGRPLVVKRPIRERIRSVVGRALDSLRDHLKSPGPVDRPNGSASRLACTTTPLFQKPKDVQALLEMTPERCSKNPSGKHGPSSGTQK